MEEYHGKRSDFVKSINRNVLKKFRKDIEQLINERALQVSKGFSKDVAEAFVVNARRKLIQDSVPSSRSIGLVDNIANSIVVEDLSSNPSFGSKKKPTRTIYSSSKNLPYQVTGSVVRVPVDKDKLVLFLEYGTGLSGKDNPHPEASRVGWEYAINDGTRNEVIRKEGYYHKYSDWQEWYFFYGGEKGFAFKPKDNSYIQRYPQIDESFYNARTIYYEEDQLVEYTKEIYVPETQMVSKKGKRFTRSSYHYPRKFQRIEKVLVEDVDWNDTEYIFTKGIVPVKFIYDTKVKIREALDKYRSSGNDISEARKMLNEIKKI